MKAILWTAVLSLCIASAARADLFSGDGAQGCQLQTIDPQSLIGTLVPCSVQSVSAAPGWQQPVAGGAQWISYGDTGYGGSLAVPIPPGQGQNGLILATVMQIRESFTASAGQTLLVSDWAGGTVDAQVRLPDTTFSGNSGADIIEPDTTNTNCLLAVPGCVHPGTGSYYFAQDGTYLLFFSVFQTADNVPFGLMYSASLVDNLPPPPPSQVPEPNGWILLTVCLLPFVIFGFVSRRTAQMS